MATNAHVPGRDRETVSHVPAKQPHPRSHIEHGRSITAIKALHSLIFLSMAASILYTLYSGLTDRISRLTGVSIAAVIGEGLVFLLNEGRCPLTDLVEDVGAEHGSVSDIFLPAWFAERIPVLFTPPFAIGLLAIGVHRMRRQPVAAAISTIVGGLFLVVPWFFHPKERTVGQSTGVYSWVRAHIA